MPHSVTALCAFVPLCEIHFGLTQRHKGTEKWDPNRANGDGSENFDILV